jgi:hypothetical protein
MTGILAACFLPCMYLSSMPAIEASVTAPASKFLHPRRLVFNLRTRRSPRRYAYICKYPSHLEWFDVLFRLVTMRRHYYYSLYVHSQLMVRKSHDIYIADVGMWRMRHIQVPSPGYVVTTGGGPLYHLEAHQVCRDVYISVSSFQSFVFSPQNSSKRPLSPSVMSGVLCKRQ